MLQLEGSHGTSRTRARQITAPGQNFRLDVGRCGRGAYFWKKGLYWEILARGWHSDSITDYQGEAEPTCCIILSKIEVPEREFLNLESEAVKENFAQFYRNRYGDKVVGNKEVISQLHDLFYTTVEKKMKTVFKVIQKNVAPPESGAYPRKALGFPACLIVRDTACITQSILGGT